METMLYVIWNAPFSNNRFKRLDLTATRNLLGYAPRDDAYEIFQADLQEWLQG